MHEGRLRTKQKYDLRNKCGRGIAETKWKNNLRIYMWEGEIRDKVEREIHGKHVGKGYQGLCR